MESNVVSNKYLSSSTGVSKEGGLAFWAHFEGVKYISIPVVYTVTVDMSQERYNPPFLRHPVVLYQYLDIVDFKRALKFSIIQSITLNNLPKINIAEQSCSAKV